MSDKISVIVPVYKVESYLDQCVQSILNQTYNNLEIILVDDGSPDNCPAMCDNWAEKDKRIKVIHKPNGGLSDARNAGMKIATGEYIAFVDSDDWIDLNFYETLVNILIKTDSDMVSAGYKVVYSRDFDKADFSDNETQVLDNSKAMQCLIEDRLIKQVVWNKLFKRNLVDGILFEVGKYHEDEFWTYQVIGKSKCVSVVDYNGYFYYQRPDSIMGVAFSKKRLDAAEAKAIRYDYLKKNFPQLADKGLIALWNSCFYFGQQALRTMSRSGANDVLAILNIYIKSYPVSISSAKGFGFLQCIWVLIATVSLRLACRLRNMLKIGL